MSFKTNVIVRHHLHSLSQMGVCSIFLHHYADDPDLFLCMLNCLIGVISTNTDSGIKALVEGGGLEAITDLVSSQIDNGDVVLAILTVIDKVSSDKKYATKVAESEEICGSIFEAIKKHFENENVQSIGTDLVSK